MEEAIRVCPDCGQVDGLNDEPSVYFIFAGCDYCGRDWMALSNSEYDPDFKSNTPPPTLRLVHG